MVFIPPFHKKIYRPIPFCLIQQKAGNTANLNIFLQTTEAYLKLETCILFGQPYFLLEEAQDASKVIAISAKTGTTARRVENDFIIYD